MLKIKEDFFSEQQIYVVTAFQVKQAADVP